MHKCGPFKKVDLHETNLLRWDIQINNQTNRQTSDHFSLNAEHRLHISHQKNLQQKTKKFSYFFREMTKEIFKELLIAFPELIPAIINGFLLFKSKLGKRALRNKNILDFLRFFPPFIFIFSFSNFHFSSFLRWMHFNTF